MEEQQFVETQAPKIPTSPFADSPYEMACPAQEKPARPPREKKPDTWKYILAAVIAVALVAASSLVTAILVNRSWEERSQLLLQSVEAKLDVMQDQLDGYTAAGNTGTGMSTGDALTPGQVYAQNVRAVVAVSSNVTADMYGQSGVYQSFGSGFILTEDGYVVTNYHVVANSSEITVTTADETEYSAELIGYDEPNDVALLKMEGEDFPCVTIGNSSALAVGDQVAAIGNPLGELTSTMTVGYVSAKDRIVNTDGTSMNMLQIDAAINSGNSGGPLFNAYGQVVGITTAKFSGTSSSGATIEGIGFAIPIDEAMEIVEDLQNFGYVKSGYLGVWVMDVDPSAQTYGLPAGAFVESVVEGLAAEEAGVQSQDIIVELGGHKITCTADLTRVLRRFEPGETTTITVYRNGAEKTMSITMGEAPQTQAPEQETAPEQEQQNMLPGTIEDWYRDFFEDFFG